MKHVLYFFDARKDSRIDLFWARSDIYVVNFDLFVFIEGVIFQKGHSYIKVVVCYGDSRIQRFLRISSHLHIKFQFWNLFFLVTKTSNQLLLMSPQGSGGETYVKRKPWTASFRKYWLEPASSRKWWWNDAFKKWAWTKFSQMAPHVLKIYILIFFSCFCIKSICNAKKFTCW